MSARYFLISASITVFGAPSGTNGYALTTKWKNIITHYWNNQTYTGSRFPTLRNKIVNFRLRMRYDPNATHVGDATIKADNYIKVVPNHSLDTIIGGRLARTDGQVTSGYYGEFDVGAHRVTVAHEFGHMLYLNDHYSKSNPAIICTGYSARNIMANGYPARIHANDINDVIEGDGESQCR